MQFNYAKYLFVLVFLLGGFFIYKIMSKTLVLYVFHVINNRVHHFINNCIFDDKNVGYNISKGGDEGNRSQHGSFYQCWVDKYGKDIADSKFLEMKNQIRETLKEKGTVFSKYGKNGVYKYWIEKYGVDGAKDRLEKKKEKLRNIEKIKKENGWHHTEETKRIIGDHSKNRIVSDETKLKISKTRMGIKYSENTLKKMSLSHKGKTSPNKGIKISEEIKDKISKKLKGKYFGKNNRPFTIDGIFYNSVGEASKKLNILGATIRYRLVSVNSKFDNYKYVKK